MSGKVSQGSRSSQILSLEPPNSHLESHIESHLDSGSNLSPSNNNIQRRLCLFQNLATQSLSLFLELDSEFRITYSSCDSSDAQKSYSDQEIQNTKAFPLDFGAEELAHLTDQLAIAFKNTETFRNLEIPISMPTGSIRWLATTGSPILHSEGELNGYACLCVDITESKTSRASLEAAFRSEQLSRAESEAAKSKAEASCRAKSFFLANLSHEICGPLSVLVSLSHALWMESEDQQLSPEFTNLLNHVRSGGEYLNLILTNLLDVSSAEKGRVPVRPKEFYLADWIENLQHILEPIVLCRRVRLHWQVPMDEEARVCCDPLRLTQVLINLAHYAIQRVEEGSGEAWIQIEHPATQLLLTLEDNGPGISPELLPEMSGKDTPLDNLFHNPDRGLRLALAAARLNLDALGGTLKMETREPQGTRFKIQIPLSSQPAHA